jgi:hypothetical protein
MRQTALQLRIIVFLVLVTGLMLSCGLAFSGTPAPTVDATTIALQLKATALSLQLTQAALNAQPQPQSTPQAVAPVAPSATETAGVTATATATIAAKVQFEYGAIELAYGEKRGSYPRKSEGITYGFQGAQGDVVTIILASSNARPQDARCKDWVASTTFTLRMPSGPVPATIESAHLSSLRDYELPGSAAYYILTTCSGGSCNGYCTEADLSLEKKE